MATGAFNAGGLSVLRQDLIPAARKFGTRRGGRPPGLPGQSADLEVCRHDP